MAEIISTVCVAITLLAGIGKLLVDIGYMRRRFDEVLRGHVRIRRVVISHHRRLAEHEEQLEEHRDHLADHHERISTLEQRRDDPPRPPEG